MLKMLFWFLLLANSALFAYSRGYLNPLFPTGREPERMAKQLNADKIKLLPASAAGSASASPVSVPTVPAVPVTSAESTPVQAPVCVEFVHFNATEAGRFETFMASLGLNGVLSQRMVGGVRRQIVYIPSQGSKENAEKKVNELRQLGVKDFYVIPDGTDMRWGISLGIFRTEEAARAQLVMLNQKGVRSARLGLYGPPQNRIAFQWRGLDVGMNSNLDKIKEEFPQQNIRDCE